MDYEQQAQNFLKQTGSKLEARYKEYGFHFFGDKQKRDIWTIKLSRGKREYIFDFGASIRDHEEMLKKYIKNSSPEYSQRCIDEGIKIYDISMHTKMRAYNKAIEAQKEFAPAGQDDRPSAYSILSCLNGYEPADNIDDFAIEYGYIKPDEALKVFEAVKKEYNALVSLYNDDELEMLNQIN